MSAEVLFGGTFDPPHMGHLIIASEVVSTLGVESLVFVPAAQNPFKSHGPAASGTQRIEMLETMTAGDSRFTVSSYEIDHPGPSRTYDTVLGLIERGELSEKPWMVVGDELLSDVPHWYHGKELLRRVRLAVVRRAIDQAPDDELDRRRVVRIPNPHIGISSRDIRQRLQDGRTIRYLVPDGVYDYIQRFSLYRAED